MSLLELIFKQPSRYDPRYDPATRPDFSREKTLKAHVEECGKRYVELRTAIQDGVIEQDRIRKLLLAIIALLVLNKVIDISQFAHFFGQ